MAWMLTDKDLDIVLKAKSLQPDWIDVRTGPGTPTYTTLRDYIDVVGSAGRVSGMTASDDGDGTITMAAGTGYIYTTDSFTGSLVPFDVAQDTTVSLTNNALNYIFVEYNGGTPRYQATTDVTTVSGTHEFVVALVYKEDTDIHVINAGQHLDDFIHKSYLHQFYHDGFERETGLATSENGTRNLTITTGAICLALHRFAITGQASYPFKLYYNDGSWQLGSEITQMPNTQYNNYGVGLADLTAQRYGIMWMYMAPDGDLYGVYGVGDYTLAQAEATTPPANLPGELASIGVLIAKIIFQKSGTNFTEITIPWVQNLGFSAATDHGALAGLTDDDHTQYLLVDGTRAMTGGLKIDSGATPSASQLLITPNDSGCLSVLAYATNNVALAFDARYSSGWYAESATPFILYKTGGELKIYGDAGKTVDQTYTPTVIASIDPYGTLALKNKLYLGGTSFSNAKMTLGLTINQGAADDEILALKSSDVTHGVTDVTETDTYGFFSKYSGSIGGLKIAGLTESVVSCSIYGYATSADQTKNAEGQGNLYINLMKKSVAGGAAHSANENLIAVTSGSDGTVWILDADGDTWQSGDITAVNITASAALAAESCTINYPRFMAPSGEALQVLLDADALEDDADRWMLEVADGGNFSLQSYATGSFVARLYLTPGGILLVGDDSNASMTVGLTINQGAADNEILALKSSDIAHGVTAWIGTETDTFGLFMKEHPTNGGLRTVGYSLDNIAIRVWGVSTNDDTTKSTAATAPILLSAAKKLGSDAGVLGANANVLAIRNYSTTVWIVDEDGDTWQSGDITVGSTVNAEIIKALDGDGLLLHDDAGNLGIKIADGGEPQGRTANPIPEVVQSTSEPGTMHPGMIWIDTDADGGQCSTILLDADGDTKVDVEESADEDIVRIDAGGNQVALWRADGSFQFEDCPRVRLEGITTAQDNLSTGGLHVVKFDEYEDPGSDYNTTTWTYTAPQDGYYFIFANIMLTNSDADCLEIYLQLTTSNKTYQFVESGNQWDADPTYWNPSCTWIAFMDQNDTATIGVIFGSGCAAQTDIFDSGLTHCEIRLLG